MLGQIDDLLSEGRGGFQVLLGDFSTHGDFCGGLDSSLIARSVDVLYTKKVQESYLDLFRQNLGEVALASIGAEAHLEDNTGYID